MFRNTLSNAPPFRLIVRSVLVGIALIGLGGYIIFQARFMILGPQLTLIEEPGRMQNQRIITLQGSVQNITKITLNGRQIFTDERGYFTEALVLENGYTVTTIAAVDRYGREVREVRSFIYTPASIITE